MSNTRSYSSVVTSKVGYLNLISIGDMQGREETFLVSVRPSGIVDDDVELTKFRYRNLNSVLPVCLFGYIHLKHLDVAATKFLGLCMSSIFIQVCKDDSGTLLGKSLDRCSAEPAGSPFLSGEQVSIRHALLDSSKESLPVTMATFPSSLPMLSNLLLQYNKGQCEA